MQETGSPLRSDIDGELERIISELAAAQRQRREAVRRQLRRQVTAMLKAAGFRVGDIFPAVGHGRRARPTTKATG